MGFWKNPVTEEPPTCVVCHVVVYDGSLVCSATCSELMTIWQFLGDPYDREDACYD